MARHRESESLARSRRVQAEFGKRLQSLRRNSARRISQEILAAALGISRTSVSNIERGRHRVFLDQAYAAAKVLGVSVADLLPAIQDVYPEDELLTSPNAQFTQKAVREAVQLTKEIQGRVANQFLAREAAYQNTLKRRRE